MTALVGPASIERTNSGGKQENAISTKKAAIQFRKRPKRNIVLSAIKHRAIAISFMENRFEKSLTQQRYEA